jgi:hypothetical protein
MDLVTQSYEDILSQIYLIRGKKVMLDSDLATIYGVETRVLNQAVKRNSDRFPDDFMFSLSAHEFETLISQFVISNSRVQQCITNDLPGKSFPVNHQEDDERCLLFLQNTDKTDRLRRTRIITDCKSSPTLFSRNVFLFLYED